MCTLVRTCVHACVLSAQRAPLLPPPPCPQQLLAAAVPLALVAQLLPGRLRVLAAEIRVAPAPLHPTLALPAKPLLRLQLPAALAAVVEEVAVWMRGAYLLLLFAPMVLSAPLVFWLLQGRRGEWMELVRWTLERAGPAFIKWGQWASTRPDMFPPDLCAALEQLQVTICWLCIRVHNNMLRIVIIVIT